MIQDIVIPGVMLAIVVYFLWRGFKRSIVTGYSPTHTLRGTKFENELIDLINHERAIAGVQELRKDDNASQYAYQRTKDLEVLGKPTHTNFKPAVLQAKGYTGVGENLASASYIAEDVVTAWMGSEEHRENLLRYNWKYIGIRTGKNKTGQRTIVNIFGN